MEITPAAQGIYYPEAENAIIKLFKSYKCPKPPTASRLLIVPHAGYNYCGLLAYSTYCRAASDALNITVIAPAIYNRIYGSVTSTAAAFITPLGRLENKAAKGIKTDDSVFECESALTVQLPLIKHFFPEASVTPVIYGCEDYHDITKLIAAKISESVIVIASNLSRFVPERDAIKLDGQTARMIERREIRDLDAELADGAVGICAAVEFAKQRGYWFTQTGLTNSSKTNNDTSSVVGYGGWYLTTQ